MIGQEQSEVHKPKQCPYLSTIKKHLLDFDFQKLCSVTLVHTNIYCCLVCGRYFQGRSSSSPAYQHCIEYSHYVYMNLQNGKIYCLPDNYQVQSHTLSDIKFNLKPHYTTESIEKLQKLQQSEYNIDGKQFYPGIVGLNNLGKSDYATTIIYLLNTIKPIRKYFLLYEKFQQQQLVDQFALLIKKIWNPQNFKGVVSPHDFLQCVSDKSEKKFKLLNHSDPLTFFLWLTDNLTKGIKKKNKKSYFNISNLFKGVLKTSIIRGIKDSHEYEQIPSKVRDIPFSILKMEFPQKGIFNKTQNQIQLKYLLEQYVGIRGHKHEQGLRYAKIIEFPEYLMLVFKRFSDNGYKMEKDSSHLIYGQLLSLQKWKYQLLTQISHQGEYETGKYKVVTLMNKKWFEVQDLEVKEIDEQQMMLTQPYIQVYKKLI